MAGAALPVAMVAAASAAGAAGSSSARTTASSTRRRPRFLGIRAATFFGGRGRSVAGVASPVAMVADACWLLTHHHVVTSASAAPEADSSVSAVVS